MQFPDSWLRHFVNPPLSNEALAHTLTMAGLEVETLRPVAPPCTKVVVARVRTTTQHPNADRLKVCEVEVGTANEEEIVHIVCGAPNVRPGMKVPCALIGATLSTEESDKPFTIKRSKLRGVESQGMLCSAKELGLPQSYSENGEGLLALPEDAPIGEDIRSYLLLDEQQFTLKLTPNRADCLSILGIAREVSALTHTPFSQPITPPIAAEISDIWPVRISAPTLCGRFAGRVIRHLNARAQTPSWMVQRLERAGQRSIHALVDISNYVMLERGRPNHVFDLHRLTGPLEVRWGRADETLQLLDGTLATLDETVGVIADEQGPQSLAGIMGGAASAISLDTTDIYLEAAFWQPDSIRGRARRYRLASEAAHRFERGVDFNTIVEDIEYITYLILRICGGKPGPVDDHIINLPARPAVQLRCLQVQRILGVTITGDEIADIFRRLDLPFERTHQACAKPGETEEVFSVTPPAWRFDITLEVDLIEEVARIYGFESLPLRLPKASHILRGAPENRRPIHAIRHQLAARDYHETINFSFVDPAWEQDFSPYHETHTPIELINPLSGFLSVMRSTLIGSLVHILRQNLNRKAERVRLFEVGTLFLRDSTVPLSETAVAGLHQPLYIGGLAYGPTWPVQWGIKPSKSPSLGAGASSPANQVDFFDVKGDIEALFSPSIPSFIAAPHPALHPGRSARIEVEGKTLGWIGELHPKHLARYDLPHAPIVFEIEAQALITRIIARAPTLSKFQPVQRDMAVMVPQKEAAQSVLDTLKAVTQKKHTDAKKAHACSYIQNIVLFDVFTPLAEPQTTSTDSAKPPSSPVPGALQSNEKSLAFRITLQANDTTLHDETVDIALQTLLEAVTAAHSARLRA